MARPIAVQEFARQEHYQKKMFVDCALERDVFRPPICSPRPSLFSSLSSPGSCLVSSLLPPLDRLLRLTLSPPTSPSCFPSHLFGFDRKRHVGRSSAATKIGMCILEDIGYVPVIRTVFSRAERVSSHVRMTATWKHKVPRHLSVTSRRPALCNVLSIHIGICARLRREYIILES